MKSKNYFFYKDKGFIALHLLGFRLLIKDSTKYMLYFSERYKYKPGIFLGKWYISIYKLQII